MAAYLIVGLPGTGKSTTLRELSALHYETLDADNDAQLSTWKHKDTGETTRLRQQDDPSWNVNYDWSWDGERLRRLIDNATERALVVGGNAANVSDFYGFFDKVFALILDDDTLRARVTGRGQGYGTAPDELHNILEWNKDFAQIEQQRGATLIDAKESAASIAMLISEAIHDAQ